MTSWKTTTAGVTAIIIAVFGLKKTLLPAWQAGDATAVLPYFGILLAGFGGLFARDNNVTSEQAGLKPETWPMVSDPRVDGYVPAAASQSLVTSPPTKGGGVVPVVLLAGLVCFAGGCTTGASKLARALAHDPAFVSVKGKLGTPWGVEELQVTRVGTMTNSITIAPDGTVTVNPVKRD